MIKKKKKNTINKGNILKFSCIKEPQLIQADYSTVVTWYIHDRYTYFILNTFLIDEATKMIFLTLKNPTRN